ncbi:MAG TPA: hypothetical protein VGU20_04210 [Stellaceae bacterium]|nr:hypothetical protein [Stellaceae bacterium]
MTTQKPAEGIVTRIAEFANISRQSVYNMLADGRLCVLPDGNIARADGSKPLAHIPRRGAVERFACEAGLTRTEIIAGLQIGRFAITPSGEITICPEALPSDGDAP